jgi:predicted nuclease of predicted toxin-antitoxin system
VRVLLDEHLPVDLAPTLPGHDIDTVVGRGWAGITNGELLQRMRGEYGVLVTMDRGIEHQQNISALPFGVILVRAASNRLAHLLPLVPSIREAIAAAKPGQIQRVGG